ncbi:MAG TPA: hemolysin family protein [Anaerolineales bacterium]|jgi:putative hemolysin
MSSPTTEILLIFLLILVNGLFAMSEIALVSSRKARLEQRADEGNRDAATALELLKSPNRFLSTVQIGISLVGVLAGALGGATLAEKLAPVIARIPWLAAYSYTIAFTLVVLVITYFSLVIGELIPKRLGLNNPEAIAARVAGPMKTISTIGAPVVRLLSASTELGLRLLGIHPSKEPPVTEEEIRLLLEQGTQGGIFEAAEQDMVESVFRLGERRVDALMTPRTEIVWLDIDEPDEQNLQVIQQSIYSRFPVGEGSLDNVIGILNSKDLLKQRLAHETINLRAVLHPPLFVPESMPALKVLEMVKNSGVPMALVIDEYGGLLGMVTLYDILEAIVGDISTTGQSPERQAQQRDDGSWLVDGTMQIDEFKDLLDIPHLPDEERAGYQTVGGFVMSQLGSIPTAGDHFTWEDWRFEVVDMDGRRVDKVLAMPEVGEEFRA